MNLDDIALDNLDNGSKTQFFLNMTQNAIGQHWRIPVMIAKGNEPGPVLGVTAALHGNELNGISLIHQIWNEILPQNIKGTIIFIPVLNTPGFIGCQREFSDGVDLNRVMPGREDGTPSQRYANKIHTKVLQQLDYLIDIHTASFGRINSLYVRVDLDNKIAARMAELFEPEIIVNCRGEAGTMRELATSMNIPTITVEIGKPHRIQTNKVIASMHGFDNVLANLGMIEKTLTIPEVDPIVCKKSYWVYAKNSGILTVTPKLTVKVAQGEVVAHIRNLFGEKIEEIHCPESAIVVAKSINPACEVGARVIHLGII